MSYELICFDMDGTLLNSKKEISQGNQDAIEAAVKAGKTVALSTGRSLPELIPLYHQLKHVKYFIAVSGALVYDKNEDKVIYANNIEPAAAKVLLDFAKTRDVMIHIHSFESIVEKDKIDRMEEFQMKHHSPMFKKVAHPVEDVRDFFRAHPNDMQKINMYHKSVEARHESEMLIQQAGINVEMAHSEISSLECSAKGVSKGSGLIELCKHLGIDVSQSIAVGDADNDLVILKTCGLPVAMGNANQNVKSICKETVSDNDHDGCAEAIYRWMLNK